MKKQQRLSHLKYYKDNFLVGIRGLLVRNLELFFFYIIDYNKDLTNKIFDWESHRQL